MRFRASPYPLLAFLIFAFAPWTIACNLGAALGLSFSVIRCALAPCIVCGLAGAAWMRRDVQDCEVSGTVLTAGELHWLGLLLATAAVGLLWVTGSYPLFWLLAVSLLLFACATFHRNDANFDWSQSLSAADLIALCGLCAIAVIITAICHRPDIDDAFYLSVPVHAIEHPELPVLTYDGMYGEPGMPILLSAYKVESYELLVGALARLFSVGPIQIAHLALPPIWAVLFVLAWAALVRVFVGRFWVPVLVVVVLFAGVLGEVHRGFGNFAFVRFHQGKAVLANVIVPLIFLFAMRFMALGRLKDWAALFASIVAGVGLSSSALFIAPAATALGSVAAVPLARANVKRFLLTAAAACIYCFMAASAIRSGMPVAKLPTFSIEPIRDVVASVLGPAGAYPLLLSILGAWTVVARGQVRRALILTPLLFFLGPLNPAVTGFLISHVIPPPIFWRVFWCLPFFLFPAVFYSGLLVAAFRANTAGKRLSAVMIAGAALIAFASQKTTISPSNGVVFGTPTVKVDARTYGIAVFVRDHVLPGTAVIAPEDVSAWMATLERHPRLVVVRAHYIELQENYFGVEDAATRRLLAAIMNSDRSDLTSANTLMAALDHYRVGALVMRTEARLNEVLASGLMERHFERHDASGYAVWLRASF